MKFSLTHSPLKVMFFSLGFCFTNINYCSPKKDVLIGNSGNRTASPVEKTESERTALNRKQLYFRPGSAITQPWGVGAPLPTSLPSCIGWSPILTVSSAVALSKGCLGTSEGPCL